MKLLLILVLGLSFSMTSFSEIRSEHLNKAEQLRDQSLTSNVAWSIVEDLTTEIGARLPGSEADAKAVAWMKERFETIGFDKVYLEPVSYGWWVRGKETASVVTPFPQQLYITALGGSEGTNGDLEGQVIGFQTLSDLASADSADVKGKIVYIAQRMEKTINGAGYGQVVAQRSSGAKVAGAKGAIAVIIRSVGTDSDRFPHTGMMRYDDNGPQIPAAALSNPDADQIERLLARGEVTMTMNIEAGFTGTYHSSNVIAEVTGVTKPDEIILIGGHLDSWDLGTGAIDDASGVAITTAAAAKLLNDDTKPGRTIRVVAFANEEQGLIGAYHYADAHADELEKHFLGSESDFGAGEVWSFDTNVAPEYLEDFHTIYTVLAPLGIEKGNNEGGGGPDMIPMQRLGMPVARLNQDGTDYFDYHHTANDTLDKIDPDALNQNVAAWVTLIYLASHIE